MAKKQKPLLAWMAIDDWGYYLNTISETKAECSGKYRSSSVKIIRVRIVKEKTK